MIHNAKILGHRWMELRLEGIRLLLASIISIMVALYFKILKSEDRVAR